MKVLLVCPEKRAHMPELSEREPLSAIRLLGQSLIEYWMSHLAGAGASEVTILASDRCEQVKAIAEHGQRWGLNATVLSKPPQLGAIEQILLDPNQPPPPVPDTNVAVLDHFPGLPNHPLFESYEGFFKALIAWLPNACTPDRVDVREVRPGVFVGTHAVIHPTAELRAPCWIGSRAHLGARCVIGPETIIEQGVFVDSNAEIAGSVVWSDTFVGPFASLTNCMASGSTIIDLPSGVATIVPDPFVLSALKPLRPLNLAHSVSSRLGELYARHKSDVLLAWKHLLLRKES